MAKDKFYRDMTDSQLRAAHKEMKRNLSFDKSMWEQEYQLLMNVALERKLNLEDDSLSTKIDTVKGYLEFSHDFVRSEEPAEYKTRGGKRDGAGRPSLGVTKKVSITLPEDVWEQLEQSKGEQSMSAFLREIILDGNWI